MSIGINTCPALGITFRAKNEISDLLRKVLTWENKECHYLLKIFAKNI